MADKTHITRQGETWDMISLDYYGTEKNASLLTRANPAYIGVLFFAGGVSLRIPERVDARETTLACTAVRSQSTRSNCPETPGG